MRNPRLVPVVRRLSPNRPFTAREEVIAEALAGIPSLSDSAYITLRSVLRPLGEEALHLALLDLLAALACKHRSCECLLRRDRQCDPRDRDAINSMGTAGENGSLPLARAFVRWCWRHWRREQRRGLSEGASSEENLSDGRGGTVTNSLDQRSEREGLYAQDVGSHDRCEEHADRAGFDRMLELIFSRSRCSEREANAYVDTKSRRGREFGNALEDSVRKAASRAQAQIRSHLALHGILTREDLEVAIEEGDFLAAA